MDADTRHQLKTNELADALGKLADKRIGYTAVVVVIAVIVLLGYRMMRAQEDQATADGWKALSSISVPLMPPGDAPLNQIRGLLERKDDGLRGAARLKLGLALKKRASDQRDAALAEQALNELRRLADDASVVPMFRAAALYNVGLLHEDARELDRAETLYRTLGESAEFAGSPFKLLAALRVDQLESIRDPVVFTPGRAPIELLPTIEPPAAANELAPEKPILEDQPAAADEPATDEPATDEPVVQEPESQPAADEPELPGSDQP